MSTMTMWLPMFSLWAFSNVYKQFRDPKSVRYATKPTTSPGYYPIVGSRRRRELLEHSLVVSTSVWAAYNDPVSAEIVKIGDTVGDTIRIGQTLSLDDAVTLIAKYCPRDFQRAALKYGFLYRGEELKLEDDPLSMARLLAPAPDLLMPDTYGTDGPQALQFFQNLETQLPTTVVRPSTGHIATSLYSDAQIWGSDVVSVWPLCSELTYLFPKAGRYIFNPNQSPDSKTFIPRHNYEIDQELDKALRRGTEVMFAAKSKDKLVEPAPFLACLSSNDAQLRQLLMTKFNDK